MKSIVAAAFGAGVLLALGGCVSGQSSNAAIQAEIDQAFAQCAADHPRRKGAPTIPLVRCLNAAEDRIAAAYPTPDRDLIQLRHAARVAIAEKVDRGQLTEADAELEFAKLASQAASEEQRRRTGRVSAAALVAATAPVTCTRIQGVTSCF